jgi:hypothetical protein
MTIPRAVATVAAGGALVLCAVTPAFADPAPSLRTTTPLVRTFDGSAPNAASRNPAVSGDGRVARVMAYESDASNIVPGDTNGATDIFLVYRAPGWGPNGTPWQIQRTELASRGLGGRPANGASSDPELDGDSQHAPKCVAFISTASNLVRGDTNHVADAFVHYFRSRKTIRVSVGSHGQQANGPSSDVSVGGDCDRVAFSSTATNLGLEAGDLRGLPDRLKVAWRPALSRPGRRGVSQVYVHMNRAFKLNKDFSGLTLLASRAAGGGTGENPSSDVDFAAGGNALVFTSLAQLDPTDQNTHEDVYEVSLGRRYRHLGHGAGSQVLTLGTRLVSQGGNGPSLDPSASDDGRHVAYETQATNLLPGDTNGVSDVAMAGMTGRTPTQGWVSSSRGIGEPGNGASGHPDISGAADFVLFDSDATNLLPSCTHVDPDGVRDVFLWNRPTGNASLESRESPDQFLTTASSNPATSSHGNYVAFESGGTVYLRYEGPQ